MHAVCERAPITWCTTTTDTFVVAAFTIADSTGLIDPGSLSAIGLPAEAVGHEARGLILSGRGPIWLYLHLSHLAHPFAWVAVHDPRLGGAVVVQRHRQDAPTLGSIVPLDRPEVVN